MDIRTMIVISIGFCIILSFLCLMSIQRILGFTGMIDASSQLRSCLLSWIDSKLFGRLLGILIIDVNLGGLSSLSSIDFMVD